MSGTDRKREEFKKWELSNLHTTAWACWQAAYSAGEESMRQRAIQCANDEANVSSDEGGSVSRFDACDNVALAIRALRAGDKGE